MAFRQRDCKHDAVRLLLAHDRIVPKHRVDLVTPDAILFHDEHGHAFTAWLFYNRHTKATAVTFVDGFPAWPD